MKLTKKMNDSATLVDVAITTGEKTVSKTCDPATIDSMISELVQLRAEMRPAKKVGMNPEQSRFYECDNLLWDTHPDPSRRGVMIAHYHGGLGWVTVRLSRAQLEDLVTDIEFSLSDLARLPGFQNRSTPIPDNGK